MAGITLVNALDLAPTLHPIEAAGAVKKWADPVREERATGHTMGDYRMGNDPKAPVVDKFPPHAYPRLQSGLGAPCV
jgi:hypothetical protein